MARLSADHRSIGTRSDASGKLGAAFLRYRVDVRSGHGAHCHARYPLSWRGELDAIVAACAGDAPTQGRLAL